MTTEILGLLIILGTLVVVILRHQIWPDGIGAKPKDAEEATKKLREEMERSADQIIARMEAHTDRLEKLVAEADKKSQEIDEKIAALKAASNGAKKAGSEPAASAKTSGGAFEEILNTSIKDDGATPRQHDEPKTWAAPNLLSAEELAKTKRGVHAATKAASSHQNGNGPEVVVSSSVADVVDLPMTPEEVAMTEDHDMRGMGGVIESTHMMQPDDGEAVSFAPMNAPVMQGYAPVAQDEAPYEHYEDMPQEQLYDEANEPNEAISADVYDDVRQASDYETYDDEYEYDPYGGTEQDEETYEAYETYGMNETNGTHDNAQLDQINQNATNQHEQIVYEPQHGAVDLEETESEQYDDVYGYDEADAEVEDEHESDEEARKVTEALSPKLSASSDKVRELLDQGKSLTDIAKEVKLGMSAIELIKQMHDQAKAQAAKG
ncbi:MAG: hypothetical protein ACI4OA_05245 [Selenomonadaceae bacterium]